MGSVCQPVRLLTLSDICGPLSNENMVVLVVMIPAGESFSFSCKKLSAADLSGTQSR